MQQHCRRSASAQAACALRCARQLAKRAQLHPEHGAAAQQPQWRQVALQAGRAAGRRAAAQAACRHSTSFLYSAARQIKGTRTHLPGVWAAVGPLLLLLNRPLLHYQVGQDLLAPPLPPPLQPENGLHRRLLRLLGGLPLLRRLLLGLPLLLGLLGRRRRLPRRRLLGRRQRLLRRPWRQLLRRRRLRRRRRALLCKLCLCDLLLLPSHRLLPARLLCSRRRRRCCCLRGPPWRPACCCCRPQALAQQGVVLQRLIQLRGVARRLGVLLGGGRKGRRCRRPRRRRRTPGSRSLWRRYIRPRLARLAH